MPFQGHDGPSLGIWIPYSVPMRDGLFSRPVEVTGSLARVVLEAGIDHPEGLTYTIPEAMKDIDVGDRVRAPLGRGDRPVDGVVVEIFGPEKAAEALGGLDPARLKPLISALTRPGPASAPAAPGVEATPRYPPNLVRLGLWISQYYCCPIGMVLAAMMPGAVKRQTGLVFRRRVERVDGAEPIDLPKSSAEALAMVRALPADAFPVEARALADRLGHKTLSHVNRLIRAGVLREVVKAEVRAESPPEWEAVADGSATPPLLTPAQETALETVSAGFGSFGAFVLFGVTGSGKTEVYLRALSRVIERGRSAIVLVPEISLTPQTAGRFLARFRQAGVAVLHSGLSASQRHLEWMRVMRGEARVVVGARSAVFAPFPPGALGLIVVDEEHDASYKQDSLPRYHARDVAIRRAQMEGCAVVLGSATPSLETWNNAATGRFRLLELPERVAGGSLPPVRVVDMLDEARLRPPLDRKHLHSLGPTLEAEITRTLAGSGQMLLLLNRRGYASYICCADASCGWYLTCRHCDVTAVYHKKGTPSGGGIVKCHHCLAETRMPATCPTCGRSITTFGFGTQRVEEEIERKFPALKLGQTMLRLDSDTMRHASDYFGALERFRRGEIRALLGTQMIAKGLDFPNVELIGVINADTALNLPDFRAEERTFQIVAQVAGRAGRSRESGGVSRVVVQSYNPGAASIRFASRHDYRGFAGRELESRREACLPPVGRMARIVCRDEDASKAETRADDIAAALRRCGGLRVRGPMACPISRIAGFYRVAVEMLAASPGPIQQALATLRTASLVKSDAKTAVDVDPVALL